MLLLGDGTTMPTEDGFVAWASMLTPESRGRVGWRHRTPPLRPLRLATAFTDLALAV